LDNLAHSSNKSRPEIWGGVLLLSIENREQAWVVTAMTKKQVLILAVLACAVFCVLCFGGYIVISEESRYQQAIALPTPLPTKTPTLKPTEIPTATPIPTPTSRPTATVDPETAKAHWGNVDIRNLLKNPDNYFGQEVHYKGEVFTIEEDASGSAMQVWVDIPGGSEFDREAVVVLFEGATDNIYKGTEIEFWGYCMGTLEGTNAFGVTIRQPMIAVEYLTYFRSSGEQIFNMAQSIMDKNNARRDHHKKLPYLLSGMLRCGHCET
jgi:hypothetical protein